MIPTLLSTRPPPKANERPLAIAPTIEQRQRQRRPRHRHDEGSSLHFWPLFPATPPLAVPLRKPRLLLELLPPSHACSCAARFVLRRRDATRSARLANCRCDEAALTLLPLSALAAVPIRLQLLVKILLPTVVMQMLLKILVAAIVVRMIPRRRCRTTSPPARIE